MNTTTNRWGDRNSQDAINVELHVSSAPVSSRAIQPSSGFGKFLQSLFVHMVGEAEPKVWQTSRGNDVTSWNVYDPTTKESASFATEAEVRSWLEQRYYR